MVNNGCEMRKTRLFFPSDMLMFFKKYAPFFQKGRHNVRQRSLCFPEEGASFILRGSKDVRISLLTFLERVPDRSKIN